MSDDGLTGSRADWLPLWKAAAAARGFSYREVDHRAGLTDSYFSRLMCGDVKEPTATTIDRINRALDIRLYAKIGPLTPCAELEVTQSGVNVCA
jgi:transcriptional regulator with XRE-family HTH domain